MKKQLLSIFAALAVSTVIAQTPSPSWNTLQNTNFANPGFGVKFLDAVDQNVVWLVGFDGAGLSRNYNFYSRTINGGTSYNSGVIFPSASPTSTIGDTANYVVANIEGIDANTAWVCAFQKGPAPYSPTNQGGGVLYRTTNGGTNWTNMTATGMYTNTNESFANLVTFLTPSVGITMGDPVGGVYEIWRTTNGGLSWNQVPSSNIPAPSSATEFGIVNMYAKYGTSNMWFGTNEGRMFYTTNAGVTWSVSNVAASTSTIQDVTFNSASDGLALFFTGAAFELYSTTNGGVSWSLINPLPANFGVSDMAGVPGTNQFVSCSGTNASQLLSFSTDNGATWTDYGSTAIPYFAIDFANNGSGWAGTYSDNTNPGLGGIYKYNGAAITSTAMPSSAFAVDPNVCLTGPSIVVVPTNSSTGSPAPTFSWSVAPAGPAFSSNSAATPSVTFSSAGTYTLTLLTTNTTGTNSSTQIITVNACSLATPSINTASSSVCNNSNLNTTNVTTGGSPAPSYSWSSVPATGVTFSPSAIAFNPSVKIATPGTYVITMMATNSQGTASDSKTITVNNCAPSPNFSVPAVFYKCEPSNRLITSNSTTISNGPNTYTWSIQPSSGVSIAPPGINAPNITANITNTNITTYTVTLRAANLSGSATPVTQTISVDFFCLSVGENNLDSKLSVYPNPAHDQLNISLPSTVESYQVKLVNVIGQVVLTEKVGNNNKETVSLNLANQPKGVYFLSVEANREKVTRKVIIE